MAASIGARGTIFSTSCGVISPPEPRFENVFSRMHFEAPVTNWGLLIQPQNVMANVC